MHGYTHLTTTPIQILHNSISPRKFPHPFSRPKWMFSYPQSLHIHTFTLRGNQIFSLIPPYISFPCCTLWKRSYVECSWGTDCSFFPADPWHMKFLGQGSDPSHSDNLSCSCCNTGSLTPCARLGIEPAFQHSQDTADPVVPQWEIWGSDFFHSMCFWKSSLFSFIYYLFALHFHSFVIVHCLNIFQYVYPFFCWWILGFKSLKTCLSNSLCGHRQSFSLSVYLWMELLSHRVRLILSKLECCSEWRTAKQMKQIVFRIGERN